MFLALALFGITPASPASARTVGAQQTAERRVTGLVLNVETKAPIAGATITIGAEKATTDRDGRFSLSVLPGRMVAEVTATGYFPVSTTLDVGDRDILDAQFSLVPNAPFSASVEVVGTPVSGTPAAMAVAPSQVLRTPGALDNVFRTLQTLPGISATEEFGSRVAVRGGSPDQNLTVMDGVEIHDPYRLFGLTSAFNPETIERFDLATGGFSVKHGDRLSSLLVVENRGGDRDRRLAGSASLSITDANVVLEGALPHQRGSWLVTGRRTYYDLVAGRVTNQQFPRFADLQAKAVWDVAPGRTLSVFGLRSREKAALSIDDGGARGDFQDDTRNDLGWARFDGAIGVAAQSHTIVSYSNSTSGFGVNAAVEDRSARPNSPAADAVGTTDVVFERQLDVRDTALRQELAWARGVHVVEAGAELHRLSTGLNFVIKGARNPTAANGSSVQGGAGLPDLLISSQRLTRGGTWLLDRWQLSTRASVEAGLRLDRSGFTGDTNLSPRVSALMSITPHARLRGAVGRYTQGPGYEKLAQSDYVLDLTNASAGRLRSERATLSSVGVERDLGRGSIVRLESYYKRFSDLLIGRLELEAVRLARVARYDFPASLASSVPIDPIITTVPTNDGRGRAYGFDLFVSRASAPADARVRGWASYTWGKADREAYGRRYAFEYDRRHAFSAVGGYRLSERWELASTVRVASGFPRTPPLGLRVDGVEDTNDVDGDGITTEVLPRRDSSGLLVYAINLGGVSNLNTGRLPMFARVDLRTTWRPRGASGRWEFYLEVINVLNRKNAGTLDPQLEYDPTSDRPRIVEKRDRSIPRLPTIGIRVKW
jgi:hypothetical protein